MCHLLTRSRRLCGWKGACWRARSRVSGQHVASYCATAEPVQFVAIEPHSQVTLYFHYPHVPVAQSSLLSHACAGATGSPVFSSLHTPSTSSTV